MDPEEAMIEEEEEAAEIAARNAQTNGSAKSKGGKRFETPTRGTAASGVGMAASTPNLGTGSGLTSSAGVGAAREAARGDNFLNYFFGSAAGMPGQGGLPQTPGSGFAPAGSSSPFAQRASNPMSERMGLEGSSAAYDMKSLDKHLEAVSDEEIVLLAFSSDTTLPFWRRHHCRPTSMHCPRGKSSKRR